MYYLFSQKLVVSKFNQNIAEYEHVAGQVIAKHSLDRFKQKVVMKNGSSKFRKIQNYLINNNTIKFKNKKIKRMIFMSLSLQPTFDQPQKPQSKIEKFLQKFIEIEI